MSTFFEKKSKPDGLRNDEAEPAARAPRRHPSRPLLRTGRAGCRRGYQRWAKPIHAMTFEMFGAGCFGAVIGFVAWHVFRAGEASLDVKQLAAFIGALLGAVVLSAFPAGTTLFAAYSCGLALGFFLVPASRMADSAVSSLRQSLNPHQPGASSEVPDQLQYIEEHWPEIERVVENVLRHNKGSVRQYHLHALPLDEAGRVSALRKYARTHPERILFRQEFLGWTLRLLDRRPDSRDGDRRRGSGESTA